MSDELDGIVTAEDIEAFDGADDDGGDSGDRSSVLDRKFGGDPDKLAHAYTELEKALGRQGNELGEVRQLLTKLIERGRDGEGAGEQSFLKDLQARVEAGDVDIVEAFKAFEQHMEKKLGSRIDDVDGRTAQQQNARVWNDFVADNPDAKRLENVMVRLVKAKPHLLNTKADPATLQSQLSDILSLAKAAVERARNGGGRRGGLDGGTSRSRRPVTSKNKNREGLFNQARDTDNEHDWAKFVEDLDL